MKPSANFVNPKKRTVPGAHIRSSRNCTGTSHRFARIRSFPISSEPESVTKPVISMCYHQTTGVNSRQIAVFLKSPWKPPGRRVTLRKRANGTKCRSGLPQRFQVESTRFIQNVRTRTARAIARPPLHLNDQEAALSAMIRQPSPAIHRDERDNRNFSRRQVERGGKITRPTISPGAARRFRHHNSEFRTQNSEFAGPWPGVGLPIRRTAAGTGRETARW